MAEVRYRELRADGRRLRGTVMQYGDVAVIPGIGSERFAAFAFADHLERADTEINVMHDQTLAIGSRRGGELVLIDSPAALSMVATLPQGDAFDDVLDLVGDGFTGGLSVEFNAIEERRGGDSRTIIKATLPALGIVDRPAYPGSSVERRAGGRKVRGNIVPGWQRIMACRCQGKDCDSVSFDRGAFDETLADPDREILAVMGDYNLPIASRRRGSLRIEQTDTGISVEIDIPETAGGKAVDEAADVAPLYTRPYLDLDRSEYVDEGEPGQKTRRFSRAWLRAVIVGATDAVAGLTEATIEAAEEERRRPARRRMIWL